MKQSTGDTRHYSVIIVGEGLAGLSVARGLKDVDRVILVNWKPIGSDPSRVQTGHGRKRRCS